MPLKTDKAIAVGMAGLLLFFISLYISMYIAGVDVASDTGGSVDDQGSFTLVLTCVVVSFVVFIIIGIASALISQKELASYKDAVKVSTISGLVPASIVIVSIVYLILYLGISAAMVFSIFGLVFFLLCLLFSAIGGMIGFAVARAYFTRDRPR